MRLVHFTPESYRYNKSLYLILYMVFTLLLLILLYGFCLQIFIATGIVLIFSILFELLHRNLHSQGLYIDGEKLYYKNFKKKEIDINEIVAIKISREKTKGRPPNFYMRDKNKNFMYIAQFLRYYKEDMRFDDYGDDLFEYSYKKSVIFRTKYDVELINYIKSKKPDIIVMTEVPDKYPSRTKETHHGKSWFHRKR